MPEFDQYLYALHSLAGLNSESYTTQRNIWAFLSNFRSMSFLCQMFRGAAVQLVNLPSCHLGNFFSPDIVWRGMFVFFVLGPSIWHQTQDHTKKTQKVQPCCFVIFRAGQSHSAFVFGQLSCLKSNSCFMRSPDKPRVVTERDRAVLVVYSS